MTTVILVIHMMLAIALVITVLLQRSEGGGRGGGGSGGGGGGGMGGLMSVRGTANLLTRATAILAAGFMGTSITLAILANNTREPSSILDRPGMTGAPDAPVKEPVGVPLSK